MSEERLAGLAAAVVVAPLCAVCVLGPAIIASIVTGVAAWFGGFDAFVAAGVILVAGITTFAIVRKRRGRRVPAKPAGEMSR